MDFLQWGIPIIVTILGILIGRTWQKYDKASEKDKKTISIIAESLSEETLYFLKNHNFGSAFKYEKLNGLFEFVYLEEKPDFFFLNKSLEKLRVELFENIKSFLNTCAEKAHEQYGLNPGYVRINRQEDYDNLEEGFQSFLEDRNNLNEKAKKILKSYENLFKLAHKIL
jgi:hypothetical protein